MKQDALHILLSQRRFDLIFKYLYVKRPCAYHRSAYLEHIRAFNNFYELNPSDGQPKNSADDFINSFDTLIHNLQRHGYDDIKEAIPIGSNGEIQDGAHRLAACAALEIPANIEPDRSGMLDNVYDYQFFRRKGMDESVMDYGALEYVKLNPQAYIVNLHSITNPESDNQVESILNQHGVIFYKKDVRLTYNGLVNLKKMSYGSYWDRGEWIGTTDNHYFGAQDHAQASLGKYPTRVYVFICDDLNKVVDAKKQIRAIYNIGNFSVHINDTHEEAVCLAETYFNQNSLFCLNNRPFDQEDECFDHNVEYLRDTIIRLGVLLDDVCCAGSTPLNQLLLRHSNDIDYLSLDERITLEDDKISPHDEQLKHYPYSKEEIITNPEHYSYYHGIKVISLDVAYKFKKHRGERPKDTGDCRMIRRLQRRSLFDVYLFKYNAVHHPVWGPVIAYAQKNKRRIKRVVKKIGIQ